VKEIDFNGKSYDKTYFNFNELQKGAILNFKMVDQPNKARGINESDFPYSLSKVE